MIYDEENAAEITSFIAGNIRGPKEVFVSIPHQWSIVKFTEVPFPKAKGKDALANMMKFEIERHIPYQIEDILFDFQLIGKSETMYKVLTVAVHKSKIAHVREFLDKIACRPSIITISPFAILNSIEYSNASIANWQSLLGFSKKPDMLGRKGEKCISIFIDHNAVYLTVLSGGSCINLSSFSLAGTLSIEAMADDISSRIADILRELSLEKLNKLLLSGTLNTLSDLSSALRERLGINALVVNPASRFLKNRKISETPQIAAGIGLCYAGSGIGTLRINLLPHKPDAVYKKTGVMVSKISIPLIVLMIAGIFTGDIVNDKRMLSRIDKKIQENEPEIKIIEKLLTDIHRLKQQKTLLSSAKDSNISLDMLSELANILPTDAWISNFHYKETFSEKEKILKGELVIGGFAQASSVLITLLEDSPFFEKVEFVGPINDRGGIEEFKIKAGAVRTTPAEIPVAGAKTDTVSQDAPEVPPAGPKQEEKAVTESPKAPAEKPVAELKKEKRKTKIPWGVK